MENLLKSLSDSDAFEELCFDLLEAEDFMDLNWRGPGADGGRDLEATWQSRDPTGSLFRTKWFIECKWYTDSVPFDEIEPKLLAAVAARADYLLVITSSRIRNTAADMVEQWLSKRGYPFRIRYWNGRDVVRYLVKHGDLFAKHFPKLSPPAWSKSDAELDRLSALIGSSSDRLTWRLVPIVQWITTKLYTNSLSDLPVIMQELDLLSCMLRAHQVFSISDNLEEGVLKRIDITECIRLVCEGVNRRLPTSQKIAPASGLMKCEAVVSRSLFVGALHEVLLNAGQYSKNKKVAISLIKTKSHWRVEIKNLSDEPLLSDWPKPLYRGPGAKKDFTSGLGLGCWLAEHALAESKLRIWWATKDGSWITKIQGAIN